MPNSSISPGSLATPSPKTGSYSARLARDAADLRAAQALRFEVFNVELGEGLDRSYASGLDADRFDDVCDHLLVEHLPDARIVGTYRLQTGTGAGLDHGYYSAQEFDFTPFGPWRAQIVELGRACVHRGHRTVGVLNLLWRGVAAYARERGARLLVGCSSLTSQDASLGAAMYESFGAGGHLAPEPWRTVPTADFALPPAPPWPGSCPPPPRLLRAYLAIGASICGPPAIDQEFQTIDFLTLLDLQNLPPAVRQRFLP